MKKSLVLLILLLVTAAAPLKAQFTNLIYSQYAYTELNGDGEWNDWSEWISRPGQITKSDTEFNINFKETDFVLTIKYEMDPWADADGFFHRVFMCENDTKTICRVDVLIDFLNVTIPECRVWFGDTAKAFKVESSD